MIKVLFDHQKFTTQKFGGISRYFANIIQQIKLSPDFDYELGLIYSQNHYLKSEFGSFDNFLAKVMKRHYVSQKLFQANEWYSDHLVKKNAFDIFHPTYYDPYFIGHLKKPLVITIHDMTYERFPEYFWAQDTLTYNKRLNIEAADSIIAISETTKSDLMKYHDIDEKKVHVIYHGIDIETPLEFQPVKNLPGQYLLYVGDRSGYKNFYLFIDAFKKLSVKYPELHVVLTGGGGVGIADKELIHRLQIQDKVSHVNVSDEELNYLYQNALLFVYPSLHEGFGLPILEAYKAKCPILLSSTPCFLEIAGEAAAYFEPYSMDDMVRKIEMFLEDPAYRTALIGKGTTRLKDFPLDESVQKTLDLYKSLV